MKQDPDDWENWFSEQDKELQQIFQGQSDMQTKLNDLHRRLEEVLGKQDRTLAVLQVSRKRIFLSITCILL